MPTRVPRWAYSTAIHAPASPPSLGVEMPDRSEAARTPKRSRVRCRALTLTAVMVVAGVAPDPAAIARTTAAAVDVRQAAATQAAHVTDVGHREHRVRLSVRSDLSRLGSSASSRGRLPIGTFVTRGFDPPARRWLAGHRGVDLAALPAAVVHAPAAGVIRFVGSIAGIGIVSVMHLNGVVSTYQPVQPLVSVGTPVLAGQPIAVVTVSGHCGLHVCLHWGAKRGFAYLNPLVAFHVTPRLMTP